MAERILVWSKRAKEELASTFKFYTTRNGSTTYSRKIRDEVHRCILLVQKYPKIGRLGSNSEARILSFLSFGIIYKLSASQIIILSFWDFRRNPDKLPSEV